MADRREPSDWARSLNKDTREAAEKTGRSTHRTQRMAKPVKPAARMEGQHICSKDKSPVHHWFGESTSEDSSEEDEEGWSTIDRENKNRERKRRTKERRSRKAAQVSQKARRMAGLGPITNEEIELQWNLTKDYEKAKTWAVKAHLSEHYDYSQDELDRLKIMETKRTNRDDIIYIATENEQDIREIYTRKAEGKTDKTTVKSYIPPQFFERFSMLNRICADKREADHNLKTQIRFGDKDLIILTKRKGESEPYRIVDFEDFTGDRQIPPFDMTIKWRIQQDRPPRRKTSSSHSPATRKENSASPARQVQMTRRTSEKDDGNLSSKKLKRDNQRTPDSPANQNAEPMNITQ